ncbi:hypothetical protein NW752_010223 [Fusarium irregulare]|uniref:Major facilitator superfamily (MFS) profile domain-containing protein n=1 Tax=Fusarium irregulare TaxID=2494466 RepID=A0A9W8U775_9HYPO|nr:hypothetical protein NW752_010223 [Fusarium irregulare]KAJ4007862.1 hypothetical protein NW766_009672 [Fusarium irregulare]
MLEATTCEKVPQLKGSWLDKLCFTTRLEDPTTHSISQKHAIVTIITLSAFTAPFASNIFFPSFATLLDYFDTTESNVSLVTTVFLIGQATAPLWWSTLSQEHGRRPVLISSFVLSMVAVIACALSNHFPLVVLFRFIEAVGCSSAQSVGAGVIGDIYISTERGSALGWFYMGTLLGPLISPIIGGGLQAWLGWRANLYFMGIFTFSVAMLTMLLLPETLVKRESQEKQPWYQALKRDVVAPLPKLKFLLVPSIALPIAYVSICYGSLYSLTTTLPFAYSAQPYNFSSIEIGLCYISNCAGYAIGSVVGGKLSDARLRQSQLIHNGEIHPVERLKTAWYGVGFVPAGLLVYGWLIDCKAFWITPLIGAFLFGLGFMLVTSTVMPFLVDIQPGVGASVVADLNLARNIMAAIGTVVSPIAKAKIGYGWWMSILALMCTLAVSFIVVVVWREDSAKKIRGESAMT